MIIGADLRYIDMAYHSIRAAAVIEPLSTTAIKLSKNLMSKLFLLSPNF